MRNFFTAIQKAGKLASLIIFFKECQNFDKNFSLSAMRLRTMPIYCSPHPPCFEIEMAQKPDKHLLMVLRQQIIQLGHLINSFKTGLTIPPQAITINGRDFLKISLPAGQIVSSAALDDIEFYAYHLGDVFKAMLGRKFQVELESKGTILLSQRRKGREERELTKKYGLPPNKRGYVKINFSDGQEICVGKIKNLHFLREECAVFDVLPLRLQNFHFGCPEINVRSIRVKIENGEKKYFAECEEKNNQIKQTIGVKVYFI